MLRTLLAIALLGCLVPVAGAQNEADGALSEQDRHARELFLLGDDLYAQGRYEEALAAFEEAYELSQRPLLLFNIANAQERSGRWEEAMASLRAYLPHADEAERARIESRIASLERRVARLRAEEPPAPAPEEPSRDRAAPVLLAASGALLAGGVVLAILARGARKDIADACGSVDGRRLCSAEASSSLARDRRASWGADALFVASAAALGVGLYLWLRPRSEGEEEGAVEASVSAGPTGGEVVLRGRF